VNGRGIAMVDPVVILEVDLNGSAIVDLHGHGLRVDPLDRPQRAVLDAIGGCMDVLEYWTPRIDWARFFAGRRFRMWGAFKQLGRVLTKGEDVSF
jgi:hypothetical protein